MLIEQDELENRRGMLAGAPSSVLNDRERRIFEARRLSDEPLTLEELSEEFDISAASASARSRCARSRRCRML
jgi:RNA polymerase sigma-32 factor